MLRTQRHSRTIKGFLTNTTPEPGSTNEITNTTVLRNCGANVPDTGRSS